MAALWAEFSEAEDRRGALRRRLRLVARAAYARTTNEVLILDLSTTGLMLETSASLATGDTIEVELPDSPPLEARVVWQREAYFGCEFLKRAPVAAISAALLRSAPGESWNAAATQGANAAFRSAAPRPSQQLGHQGLILILAILLLSAAGIFMLALLTLPFSAL